MPHGSNSESGSRHEFDDIDYDDEAGEVMKEEKREISPVPLSSSTSKKQSSLPSTPVKKPSYSTAAGEESHYSSSRSSSSSSSSSSGDEEEQGEYRKKTRRRDEKPTGSKHDANEDDLTQGEKDLVSRYAARVQSNAKLRDELEHEVSSSH